MGWGFINVGARAVGHNTASLVAALPVNHGINQVLIIVAYARGAGTNPPRSPDLPADWSEAARYDGSYTYGHIAVFYKIHDGSETDVTVSFSGSGGTGSVQMVAMLAFSGNNTIQAQVLGSVAADSFWSAAQNIGPITGLTPADANSLLLVLAARQQDMGTNGNSTVVDVLTQSGLTFAEAFETGSTIGSDCGIVVDYSFLSGSPAITDKTFINADTQTAAGCGMMVCFKIAASQASETVTGSFLQTSIGAIVRKIRGFRALTGNSRNFGEILRIVKSSRSIGANAKIFSGVIDYSMGGGPEARTISGVLSALVSVLARSCRYVRNTGENIFYTTGTLVYSFLVKRTPEATFQAPAGEVVRSVDYYRPVLKEYGNWYAVAMGLLNVPDQPIRRRLAHNPKRENPESYS